MARKDGHNSGKLTSEGRVFVVDVAKTSGPKARIRVHVKGGHDCGGQVMCAHPVIIQYSSVHALCIFGTLCSSITI